MSTRLQNKYKDTLLNYEGVTFPEWDVANVNVYAPNNSASKYMNPKQQNW